MEMKERCSMSLQELKAECKSLYNSLPKDEDGFVLFGEDNSMYLKLEMYGNYSVKEIIAACIYDDGTIELWEQYAEEPTSPSVYDDCEREIYDKLLLALRNARN